MIAQNSPELLNNAGVLINGCPSSGRRKRALDTAVDCSEHNTICIEESQFFSGTSNFSNTIANLDLFENLDSILFLNGGANKLATMWVIGDPHILSFKKQIHEECQFNGEILCFKSNFVTVTCSAGRIFFPNKSKSTNC